MNNAQKYSNRSEKGQTLMLVVASAVGIMALLALTLDGGFALMRRRAAQNAADAGALAGARELCESGDPASAVFIAERYATSYNDAQFAKASSIDGIVTVDATAQYNSFFAGIFGISQIDVEARAKAGCFAPGLGEGVLPTAWSCRPPVDDGSATPDASYNFSDCDVDAIEPLTLQLRRGGSPQSIAEFHAAWYPELYVIMDSPKTSEDIVCLPEEGGIQCDLDGDGDNDLLADGDRSWLDLDGGGGGSRDLRDWILDGYPDEIFIHTWIPGQQGVSTSVFYAAATRIGEITLVPVFNAICEGSPYDYTACFLLPHSGTYSGQDYVVTTGGTFTSYFHVIGFAAFYVSCVHGGNLGACPGHTRAVDLGSLDENAKTVEGYFINKGFLQGISGQPRDGVDTGVYTVYLVE